MIIPTNPSIGSQEQPLAQSWHSFAQQQQQEGTEAPPSAPAAPAPSTPAPSSTPAVVDSTPPRPQPRTLSVREALGLPKDSPTPREQIKKQVTSVRERHANGQFKPMAPAGGKKEPKEPLRKKPAVDPAKPEDKVDEPPATPATPAADPAKPEPTPEPKFLFRGKAMTAAEIDAEIERLEKEKAAAAPATPPAAPAAPAEPQPSEEEQQKARAKEFLESRVQSFKPEDYGIALTPADLDVILTGGEPAVQAMIGLLARVAASAEMNTREWAAREFNREFADIRKDLAPVKETFKGVHEHQADAAFAAANPDIAAVPNGMETKRAVETKLRKRYDQSKRAVGAGIADEEQTEYVRMFESLTPEQLQADIAAHTRKRLGLGEAATPPAAPPTPPAEPAPATPPPARPKPPVAHPPGGGGGPKAVNPQRQIIQTLHAAGI